MKENLFAAASVSRIALTGAILFSVAAFAAEGTERGAQAYRACVACHSLEPGRHLTGPSLANVVGRKAGEAPGFQRYSDALKRSGIVWDERSLDAWLRDPAGVIPGNVMTFGGIKDEKVRRDLIAYLKTADSTPSARRPGFRLPDLKMAPLDAIVKAVRHCGDTFFVTTQEGKVHKIWEFNLRLKIDSRDTGPHPRKPVMVGAGMQGDRASIVFSALSEIGELVKENCG
ncbi:MAG TPA: cytochrome c family protein [Burkholderiales bacterium]|nr:cytochrome c family protein [Burkholderiales bacterium]